MILTNLIAIGISIIITVLFTSLLIHNAVKKDFSGVAEVSWASIVLVSVVLFILSFMITKFTFMIYFLSFLVTFGIAILLEKKTTYNPAKTNEDYHIRMVWSCASLIVYLLIHNLFIHILI